MKRLALIALLCLVAACSTPYSRHENRSFQSATITESEVVVLDCHGGCARIINVKSGQDFYLPPRNPPPATTIVIHQVRLDPGIYQVYVYDPDKPVRRWGYDPEVLKEITVPLQPGHRYLVKWGYWKWRSW